MAIRLPLIMQAKKHILSRTLTIRKKVLSVNNIPKGYLAVYVGEEKKKKYVVPISYLHQPAFQQLLGKAEEEFGFNHPMGGLTIPCREDIFVTVTSQLEV
ncbi:putative small auxin-up RNA [Medicago truncatula]|uniref:Putative small auxin-up RNA n=1 Tax=Medicago truncatula TaxID=3880 RepID=G7JL51_MEDTR|nr:auxin-responsive protein SAUR21 [Medicago truncatula]AES89326.1 SAUR-like auxin-responsive family protein [Medicago truncatula]AFK35610.1 unknown [Medicago truncatula]RHN61422.1 putative small auxin-up RNA [Medicago truncatula]